ncbi:MAG: hypothetical protein OER43_18425 [Gammaproteobacteria bacterium]|nr:hypothetical protein [Gammaproteobacteria bacterium]
MVLLAALAAAPQVVRGEVAGEEFEYLVRRLGYGAGIHLFKNYLLRGRPDYATQARLAFDDVLDRLDAIDRAGSADGGEEAALAELQRVVLAHREAVDRIAALREKGWRIADIDRSVAVEIAPAKAALERLRDGRDWSELAEIEYQLGFGRGIHYFKDFVLRGRVEDQEQARAALQAAEAAAETALQRAGLAESDLQRFRILARTAATYRSRLALVARLHVEGRPPREVDLAVKINDGPALRALAGLRGDRGG